MITSFAAAPIAVKDEAVLFAFDDHSIPLQDNLFLTFKRVQKHPANPVLRAGPPGSPDDRGCIIYGSVLPVDGKLRMWYLAWPRAETSPEACGRPMAYAESSDGVHWERPGLGLVDWNGSRDNNLCLIEPGIWPVDDYLCVLHDPDDPDPGQRYKLAYIFRAPASTLRPVGNDQRRLARPWPPPSAPMACAGSSSVPGKWRSQKSSRSRASTSSAGCITRRDSSSTRGRGCLTAASAAG